MESPKLKAESLGRAVYSKMKGIKIMENNVELNNIKLDNTGVNTPGTVGADANTQQTQGDKLSLIHI
mgnify:CR=1 FL=1